jgi:hypothetical protein
MRTTEQVLQEQKAMADFDRERNAQGSNELVPAEASGDGFGVKEKFSSLIRGASFKFDNGIYRFSNRDPFPVDEEHLVLGITFAWIKFQNRELADRRVTRDGAYHPMREDLPDMDRTQWPIGLNDQPEDPWKDFALPLSARNSYSNRAHISDLDLGRAPSL